MDLSLIGAVTALWIYGCSIWVFLARLAYKPKQELWAGNFLYLSAIPLIYLLFTASKANRPALYTIQIVLMLLWLVMSILLERIVKFDFRQERGWVIAYVMLFFAGTGGMLGVASLAGRGWMFTAIILFLLMSVLTFYQRAKTGK